jgi:hypothetical protein
MASMSGVMGAPDAMNSRICCLSAGEGVGLCACTDSAETRKKQKKAGQNRATLGILGFPCHFRKK